MTAINSPKQQSGFALLITILVLSVVVAVTLAIVELSLKQLKLSVDSTDSEIAFHAANAGLECARYTRRVESDNFESGANVQFNCFGSSATVAKMANPLFPVIPAGPPAIDGQVGRYQLNIDWGTTPNTRCTSVDITSIVATTTIVIGNNTTKKLPQYITGYSSSTKTCEAGERCTIMSVIGYSSACSDIASPGVLKREILLEL